MNDEATNYQLKIRSIMRNFPAVEEYLYSGTPAFKIKKKLLARFQEDRKSISIHSDDRDNWIEKYPNYFYVTPHFQKYPNMLIRLDKIPDELLQDVLIAGYKEIAPKRSLRG